MRVARIALTLAVIPSAAMGYAAWCGGQLAHPEIRAEGAAVNDGSGATLETSEP
jgi:hypothetical protein